jgi:hypothetical protein
LSSRRSSSTIPLAALPLSWRQSKGKHCIATATSNLFFPRIKCSPKCWWKVTALGALAGLKPEAITSARSASAADPKTDAILKLARAIVVQRGEISQDDFDGARQEGITDGEVAEVVANVALNIFTNYFSHISQTDIDFPEVEPGVESTGGTTASR